MLALTLYQPWAFIVVHGGKDIENRPWAPPLSWMKNKPYFAIHAGLHYDKEGAEWLRARGSSWQPEDIIHGAILGTARIGGVVKQSDSRWFIGPFGWLLEDIRPIKPLSCRGMQGLWPMPAELEKAVREQTQLDAPVKKDPQSDFSF